MFDARCPEILQLVDSYRAFEWVLRAITESVYVYIYTFFELFFNINFIFNGKIMLYRIMLVSAKHQHESAIGIHISPPS